MDSNSGQAFVPTVREYIRCLSLERAEEEAAAGGKTLARTVVARDVLDT